jgi:flavorubredoxin
MADTIAESLRAKGITAKMYNMGNTEFAEISAELIDSRGLVLVTPTIMGNMHPLATLFMNIVKLYKASFQYGAIITSYGWAKSATKYATDAMEAAKIEIVGSVDINGPALEDDIKAVLELAKNLAAKIKTG